MLAVTMQDLGTFFGGLAALIGSLGLIHSWFKKAEKNRIDVARDLISGNMLAVVAQAGVDNVRVIDIAFCDPKVSLCIPVVLGQWIAMPWGLFILGDDFARNSTSYLVKCDQTSRLLTHTHEGTEIVTVLRGTMTDLDTDRTFTAGMRWEIPAEQPHRVRFDAPLDDRSFLALVEVLPPLPNPIQRPIDLSALPKLLERRH